MKNGIFLSLVLCCSVVSAEAKSAWVCTQAGSNTDVLNNDDQVTCDQQCSGVINYRPKAESYTRDAAALKKHCGQVGGTTSNLDANWLICECVLK